MNGTHAEHTILRGRSAFAKEPASTTEAHTCVSGAVTVTRRY